MTQDPNRISTPYLEIMRTRFMRTAGRHVLVCQFCSSHNEPLTFFITFQITLLNYSWKCFRLLISFEFRNWSNLWFLAHWTIKKQIAKKAFPRAELHLHGEISATTAFLSETKFCSLNAIFKKKLTELGQAFTKQLFSCLEHLIDAHSDLVYFGEVFSLAT